MLLPALMAMTTVAYAPPTDRDVYEAFIANILEPIRFSGQVLVEPIIRQRPEFPAELVIERCAARNDRAVLVADGFYARFDGYECVFEIFPNAEPSFRSVGFFRFDGLEWIYHGPAKAVSAPSFILKDNNNNTANKIILKDGALQYEGAPRNPFNENYDPYEDLFDFSERRRDQLGGDF